jgi:hypothetical protein
MIALMRDWREQDLHMWEDPGTNDVPAGPSGVIKLNGEARHLSTAATDRNDVEVAVDGQDKHLVTVR